jgi:hypothetical protein
MNKIKNFSTWFYVIVILGILWNIFGVFQFIGTLNADQQSLMLQGMTAEQANVMLTYPIWMTMAFAIGVFGGLFGSVLLVFKNKNAFNVLLISFIGYIVLYYGDMTEGVFAALGIQQVTILSTVVIISGFLLWFSKCVNFKN